MTGISAPLRVSRSAYRAGLEHKSVVCRAECGNNSAKEGSFVAAAYREWSMKFNLMASMDCEPRTASLAFGVLVKFIMELSQIGVDAVPQNIHLARWSRLYSFPVPTPIRFNLLFPITHANC